VADAARPTISTHVLDTERGTPAPGVRVTLSRLDVGNGPIRMTQALTDSDGRVRDLLERPLVAGDYRLEFDVGAYFTAAGRRAFYPRVTVDFIVTDVDEHYHVPLLLSPFAYSTYRGS
jgi:5-hydroxyisourate hydrolase